MLFSYKLLSQLVDLSSFTPETLRNRLTFAGFEVEGMEKMASASNVIIGHILTCIPHPDSDHLHVLTVDCGAEEGILDIVCGAPNARAGINVIVALPGCDLPALNTTIKRGVVRGIPSNGMCCSLLELGVDKESLEASSPSLTGIEELSEDAVIGNRDVLGYLSIDDTILDINVLPNRPDCLSYLGMAREIAALTKSSMKEVPIFENKYPHTLQVNSESQACDRFDALRVDHIVMKKETPLAIKRTLLANGIRSIDPIVDLGNYSMLLTGQPLNMYDADKNPSNTYIVKDNYQGKFICFDDKEIDLITSDIVVTDGNENLCLAGIMAGKNACVDKNTKNIVIEAADFYHANIRHTSNRLGLTSASSNLFAKGRNAKMIDEAMAVTISLLDDFFESYEIVSYASYNVAAKENKPFAFSLAKLNERLGSSYSEDEVQQVLDNFRIKRIGADQLLAPIDRVDLNEQCDIDEEVFRFYPADRITPSLNHFPLTHGELTPAQKMKLDIRELLVSRGFDEILSFTLISEKEDKSIRVFSSEEAFKLVNPMTKDHEIVRVDLLPSMLSTIKYNVAHQNSDLALFEISNLDTPSGSHVYLSIGMTGGKALAEKFSVRPYDFFDLKGIVEAILNKLGVAPTRYSISYSTNSAFHPKASADLFMGKVKIGTFGQLHPNVSKDKVFLAEIDLGYLFNLKGLKTKFSSFDSFPMVRRDLSFKMNDKVTYAQLKKQILSIKNTYVRNVDYFDDFTDKTTGEKYLGISLLLGKEDGTLNDAEISSTMEAVKTGVKSSLGLVIRGE